MPWDRVRRPDLHRHREQVDREIGGFTFPATWLQSINPVLIIIGAPLAGALWLKLGHRVSTPWKFAVGLVFNGLSFMLMVRGIH